MRQSLEAILTQTRQQDGAVDKVLNPVAQDAGLLYRGRPVRMESGIGSFNPLYYFSLTTFSTAPGC
jgi:hypothetical protein